MNSPSTGLSGFALKKMGKRCSCVWPIPLESNQVQQVAKSPRKKKKVSRTTLTLTYPLVTTEQQESIPGRIFVSNRDAAKDSDLLTMLNVTAVMSIGAGKGGNHPGILNFIHFGIRYKSNVDYLPVFYEAAEFAKSIIAEERNILVHCQGGMHRSPVVVASLLIHFVGLSASDAMKCVKATRPTVDFSSHDGLLVDQQLS